MRSSYRVFILLLIFSVLSVKPLAAKQKVDRLHMHAKVYLKNDSVVEGYVQNSHPNLITPLFILYTYEPCANDKSIYISQSWKFLAKQKKYSIENINCMVTWYDEEPEAHSLWVPEQGNFAYGNDEPIELKHPSMMKLVFKGRHVEGFYCFYTGLGSGDQILYKTAQMEKAKALFSPKGFRLTVRRETLLEEFSDYPEMQEFIQGLKRKDLKANPLLILEKFDEVLDRLGALEQMTVETSCK